MILNCAAYTNVDGAEADPIAALDANAWAVRTLAHAARSVDATLVHYSTNFVFDGEADRPYTEEDQPNPRGVYAMSKLLGEWFAAEAPRHFVLRVVSLFGGASRHGSVNTMRERIRTGVEVRAFADQTVSPSQIDDVVAATEALVMRECPYGLYHCVNNGAGTWDAIAHEIARLEGRPGTPITCVRLADAQLVARRPRYAALSNEKLARAGVEMPSWQDALERYIKSEDRTIEN